MKIITEKKLRQIINKVIKENEEFEVDLENEIPMQNRFEFEDFMIGAINSYKKLSRMILKDIQDIDSQIDMNLLKKRESKQKELKYCKDMLQRLEGEYKKVIKDWEENKK